SSSDEKAEKTITMAGDNDKTYLFDKNGVLIKEWIKLNGITITAIPESANTTGTIAPNTLSYGSSYKLTAKIDPINSNETLDPVWTSSDPSVIKVTSLGSKNGEIYARIDVLKYNADPITISVEAGEENIFKFNEDRGAGNPYSNRQTATIEVTAAYPVGWHKIDGRTYYGIVDGGNVIHATGWRKSADGNAINGKDYYFEEPEDPEDPEGPGNPGGAMVTGFREIGGHLYEFGDDGVLKGEIQKNGFVKFPEGTFYYDGDGNLVKNKVVSDKHGNHFYLDATDGHVVKGGWIDFGPVCLYAGDDGVLAEGITVIGNRTYCFTDSIISGVTYPCALQYGFYEYDGSAYYSYESADADKCSMAFGYFKAGEKFYYATPRNGSKPGALQSGWVLVDGVWRCFDGTGVTNPYAEISSSSANGWINVASTGKRYYRKSNGNFLKGWQTIEGNKYYFDADGSVATGLWTISAKYYYFGENSNWDSTNNVPLDGDNLGIMQTGRVTYTVNEGGTPVDHTNFFNSSGIRQTGWQKYATADGDKWDFFRAEDGESLNAEAVAGQSGWYKIGTARYYFINNTTLAKGFQTVDGKKYYFDTSADVNGVVGRMVVGILTVGSNKYYLLEDETSEWFGTLLTGHSFALDANGVSREYYANGSGVLQLGWQLVGTRFEFFDYEKGYKVTINQGSGMDNWVILTGIDGGIYKYYLKNAATPVTGLQTIDGIKYLFGNIANDKDYGRLLTGLIKYGNNYYYGTEYSNEAEARAVTAGQIKTGWFTVNESGTQVTRYANASGVIQTGWV
ncbi:MAG: hypothetical protein IK123_00995, partial [Lachnospiraceae bacterium]|nr:hypothetical protein [Lachnospiraceae bacterium]